MVFNPLKKINDAKNNLNNIKDTAKSIGDNKKVIAENMDKVQDMINIVEKFLIRDDSEPSVSNLLKGNVGKVIHQSDLHENVNNLLIDLRKLVNNINNNPEKFNINIDKKTITELTDKHDLDGKVE